MELYLADLVRGAPTERPALVAGAADGWSLPGKEPGTRDGRALLGGPEESNGVFASALLVDFSYEALRKLKL